MAMLVYQRVMLMNVGSCLFNVCFPPVNEQFDPGSCRVWKMSETINNWLFSGSNCLFIRW